MSDRIPLAGVIGSPIAHSKSPRLQNYWLSTYGIAGYYIPMDVAQEDLRDALRTLPKLGFVGVNVTIPHKETVLGLADQVTDRAALIGAANTLIFRADGTIHADNTDGYGFVENLRQGAPGWTGKEGPAAVIGTLLARRAAKAHQDYYTNQIQHGGILMWVRTRDPHRQPHQGQGRGPAGRVRRPDQGL